jgi:hypothetical protein
MRCRPAILAFFIAFPAWAAAEPGADGFARGEQALADRLWEVAAMRFSELLDDPTLAAGLRARAELRLAEAWIRAGRPAEALVLLETSAVGAIPEAYFWRGQALAGLGRFAEAVDVFGAAFAEPAPPHRKEAVFTRANLQLSLDQSEAALDSLDRLAALAGAATAAEARLGQAEILLDLGRAAAARKLLPQAALIPAGAQPQAAFLEASLLLAEGDAASAASRFATLLDQPQGQTLIRHHAAAVGLADALHATDKPRAASDSLLDFVAKHPDSPLLDPIFRRLLAWLPEQPSATDPVIERLAVWCVPPPAAAPGLIASGPSGAAGAWPSRGAAGDLAAFALFTRAIALHRLGAAESKKEARFLLTRLWLEQPSHFLASRGLLEMGRWLLDEGDTGRASALLDAVRESTHSPLLRGQAAFVEGRAAYADGRADHAAKLFDQAAEALLPPARARARFNAALARLANGEFIAIQAEPGAPADQPLQTELQLEQALAAHPPADALGLLGRFLDDHPGHPRAPEARLAAAEAALAMAPPDLDAARAQLGPLRQATPPPAGLPPARIALARLRLVDLENDPDAAIESARALIDAFPAEPAAAEAAFILGRNYFQTGRYNDARLELEKLAAAETDPARTQAAWLLAARAAALVPTLRSREEALGLFDRAIASDGNVTGLARMLKARLMIDLGKLPETEEFLRPWLDSLAAGDAQRLPAGRLLAEALAQTGGNPAAHEEALAIYDELLRHPDTTAAQHHELHYLRGRILEELPKAENPEQTREAEALDAYYSVLESATQPPAEWHYFELSGLRALTLLENAQRWKAAIAVAEKIASFGGPQAEDIAKRAQGLRLKHMIWEE